VYAGYSEVSHTDTQVALICGGALAAGPLGVGVTPRGYTGIGVTNCNPDFSWYQVGIQTQWNPHPSVAIRLDLGLIHLNTAFAGAGSILTNGARPTQTITIEDQDVFYVQGRWEYTLNF
jgi:hypothetical protein